MKKIIAIINSSGGSGKTTVGINLAAGLAKKGKSVLFIDNCSQMNATDSMLPKGFKPKYTVRELYYGVGANEIIVPSLFSNVDIISGTDNLCEVEADLKGTCKAYLRLREALKAEEIKKYDYVTIDTSPSRLMIENAIYAADKIIIPVDGYSTLKGVTVLGKTLDKIEDERSGIKIDSVIMTKVKNSILYKQIRRVLEENLEEGILCKTEIPYSLNFAKSPMNRQSIYDYAPGTNGAIKHMMLVEELLEKWEKVDSAI